MSRKFGIQVNVYHPERKERIWQWLHPTDGPRYEFDSGDEAHRMKEMCYPHSTIEEVRVAEITE